MTAHANISKIEGQRMPVSVYRIGLKPEEIFVISINYGDIHLRFEGLETLREFKKTLDKSFEELESKIKSQEPVRIGDDLDSE